VTIDTGAFIAGVAVLVTLDVAGITMTFQTWRVATRPDERTQETAQEAADEADRAHRRLDRREDEEDRGRRVTP